MASLFNCPEKIIKFYANRQFSITLSIKRNKQQVQSNRSMHNNALISITYNQYYLLWYSCGKAIISWLMFQNETHREFLFQTWNRAARPVPWWELTIVYTRTFKVAIQVSDVQEFIRWLLMKFTFFNIMAQDLPLLGGSKFILRAYTKSLLS